MIETKTVSNGRLWGEAFGMAALFIAMQIVVAALVGMIFGIYVFSTGQAVDFEDPVVAAKLAFFSLPFAVAATLFVANWLLKSRGVSWRDIGLKKPDRIFFTIATGIGIGVIAAFVSALTNKGLEKLGYVQDLSVLSFLPGDFLMYIYMATVVSWFAAAFGEEFIFRGLIMGNIAKALGDDGKAWAYAAVLQAVIFGLFHAYQGFNGIVSTGVIALVFGLFYYRMRSLWPLIVAHGALDTFGMSALYFGWNIPA